MKNLFTQHPGRVGESYWQHFYFALSSGLGMLVGGIACSIHAFFPFFFEKTGSNILFRILHTMVERTPRLEERFVTLARAIEKKAAETK